MFRQPPLSLFICSIFKFDCFLLLFMRLLDAQRCKKCGHSVIYAYDGSDIILLSE